MFYDNFYSRDHGIAASRWRCRTTPFIVHHLQRTYGVLSFSYLFASPLRTSASRVQPYFGVMHLQRQQQRHQKWHPE